MRNMSEEKKLQIKSELVKHLETANTMKANNVPSSDFRVETLKQEIYLLDAGYEPNMKFWNAIMEPVN